MGSLGDTAGGQDAIALALMHRHEAASGATGAAKAGTASVLTALKVSSLIVAIPLMVCIVIAVWSFLRWIKEDQAHLDKERAPRNHD